MKIGRATGAGMPPALVPVTGRDQLLAFLDPGAPGMQAALEIKRKETGKVETVTATLAERPDAVPDKFPDNPTAKKALGKNPPKKEKGEVGLLKKTNAAGDRSYWIYVPESYDPNIRHAVVIWLHPPGRNRERDIDDFVFAWQGYCEDNHLILVGPNADAETGWNPGDAPLIQEAVKFVTDTYSADPRRMVVHGMGQGGQMAYYLGFNLRPLVRGVATVAASLTSNPKDKVASQPVRFFLVAGGKDPLKDAIKESRAKLVDLKYAVVHREVAAIGHEYLDGANGQNTLDELVRWIDALDGI
jgi:poly(3-hydroxybutyrate) depolymerase